MTHLATPDEALRYHVSGAIKRAEAVLQPPERHQLKIARDSMRKTCVGLSILGGPNHYESARIIARLTRELVGIDSDCTCSPS